jgi:hypothetical protein
MAPEENPYRPPESEGFIPEQPRPQVDYGSEEARRQIRSARIALMIVGVLSLGVLTYHTVELIGEMRRLGVTFAELPAVSLVLIVLGYMVCATYVVLSFVAKRRPFGASLAGLLLYLADILVGAVEDPHTVYRGLVIKIVIIVVLVRAVNAGLQYRRHVRAAGPRTD